MTEQSLSEIFPLYAGDLDYSVDIEKYNNFSVYELLRAAASRSPGRIIFSSTDEMYSAAEFLRLVDETSKLIEARLGQLTRVALLFDNDTRLISLLFAFFKLGVPVVPIHRDMRGATLARLISECGPDFFFYASQFEENFDDLSEIRKQCDLLAFEPHHSVGDFASVIENASKSCDHHDPRSGACLSPEDTLLICFTSGTSGKPKGARITQSNAITAAVAAVWVSDFRQQGKMLLWEPLSHLSGIQLLVVALITDCEIVVLPRFSARTFLQQVKSEKVEQLHYLGGVLQILNKQPPSEVDQNHGARIAWGAGCPASLWKEIRSRYGLEIRECYGLTETAGFVSANLECKEGSVGKPLPWFNLSILSADGEVLRRGETGEIVVTPTRSGVIAKGYINEDRGDKGPFRSGSFFTGDKGKLDDGGNLHFVGRLKDYIRHKGENVSAWEVESTIRSFEGVEDCAVVGVETEIGEQDIKAFVQFTSNVVGDLMGIKERCARSLAKFQVPRYFVKVTSFERTPSERIIKGRLPLSTHDAWDSWQLPHRH